VSRLQIITHTVVLIVLAVCYTVITALGHDGNPLLGVIAGYLGGAGIQQQSTKTGPLP